MSVFMAQEAVLHQYFLLWSDTKYEHCSNERQDDAACRCMVINTTEINLVIFVCGCYILFVL